MNSSVIFGFIFSKFLYYKTLTLSIKTISVRYMLMIFNQDVFIKTFRYADYFYFDNLMLLNYSIKFIVIIKI
jgi:hypothetical protein